MTQIVRRTPQGSFGLGRERSYTEIVQYLDQHWSIPLKGGKERFMILDKTLGKPSQAFTSILVTGTNGKSLTANFIHHLLKEEGVTTGTLSSPHILAYNERITLNKEAISNKSFAELANDVINAAALENLTLHSSEILTAIAYCFFKKHNVEVAILETPISALWKPQQTSRAKVIAVTRITSDDHNVESDQFAQLIKQATSIVTKGAYVVSADQSKLCLQLLQQQTTQAQANWIMPIRKLATLPYPFEQLHGRCAALAERTAQIYAENYLISEKETPLPSLLVKPKGKRGRPTLEAKRRCEISPKKTVEQFWSEYAIRVPARFQLLDREKPQILLDNAHNADAVQNLLLGIRLLHYQKTLKGLAIIIGCEDDTLHSTNFLRQIRYFFKKTSGHIIFCPVKPRPDCTATTAWNVEQITNDVKNLKVKAHPAANLAQALELATKLVDERSSLIAITGSHSIIAEYWQLKG